MGRTDARVAHAMTWRRVCATMLMLVGRAGCACASSELSWSGKEGPKPSGEIRL